MPESAKKKPSIESLVRKLDEVVKNQVILGEGMKVLLRCDKHQIMRSESLLKALLSVDELPDLGGKKSSVSPSGKKKKSDEVDDVFEDLDGLDD